ncbi:hypothetical protein CDAR_280131 [Caerostris darwini]|uniref:Uncharacterized protein n=1 Tax=Caerostris darwini TaxID=1538125 RepID=A0AAV4S6K8_9ARAC|nr:hypothetical protein CDAR_280131 [Caerostris darwini]
MEEENFRNSLQFRTSLLLSGPHVSQIRLEVAPGVVSGTNRKSSSRSRGVRRTFPTFKKLPRQQISEKRPSVMDEKDFRNSLEFKRAFCSLSPMFLGSVWMSPRELFRERTGRSSSWSLFRFGVVRRSFPT